MLDQLNRDQRYLATEFYEDYRAGRLTRRAFIRRMVFISGGMAAAVALMSALGCSPAEIPAPTEPVPSPEPQPTPEPTSAPVPGRPALVPVPGAQSPLSVPEGDPAVVAEKITFTAQDDEISGYLARPVADDPHPAILVCHENRGLNDHIRDVARRLAKAGYVALAIDLLSREGGTSAHGPDEVPGLLGQAGPERHVGDFIAGFQHLESMDGVDDARVGMIGFCFGGGITWDVATQLPELKAAVPFYGRAPDMARVADIRAAVLGVYAEQDSRITSSMDALDQALSQAGVTHEMKVYPGVGHAFHNDTGGRYDQEQATRAWQDALAWFRRYV